MPKRYLTLFCVLLSLMIVVLSGCQTVGGIDLNKVFLNDLNIQSYEGEEAITVDFTLNPKAEQDPEYAELSLFKNIKLSLTNIKGQDPKQLSADGAFTYSKGTVPFKLSVTGDQAVLQIEGAKKPLVLDLKAARGQSGLVTSPLLNDQQKVIKELAPFIIEKLPNPKTVKVEPASVKAGPDTLNTNKLHAEIKGNEVVDLVKTTITNLLSDEKGLQDFAEQATKLVLGDSYTPVIGAIARTQAKEYLQQFAASLDQNADNPFLNENNYLKTDYYIDQDQNVRKADVELYIGIPAGDDGVIKAVKVNVSSAVWNLNKPVTASVIDTNGGAFKFGPDADTKLLHVIKDLDPNSEAYKLLVKELKVTRKDIRLRIVPQDKAFYGPYIDAQTETALAPARLFSYQLGAELTWNDEKQQVTFTDILSGKTIVLTIGSNTALVDGQPVSLDTPVVLKKNSAYVPVRFIAETFGFQVGWDNSTHSVTITRD